MALSPTRLEFRVTLSHVDRAIDLAESVYVARHPSETQDHVVLRMLAWCLFYEEGLAFGPGLSTPDAADLWTHDATGRLTTWIECGTATAERLRKALSQHAGARTHVLLDDARAAATLRDELAAARWPRACPPPTLWLVDAELVPRSPPPTSGARSGRSPSSATTSTSTSTGARSTARSRRIRPRREPEAADDAGVAGARVGAHRAHEVADGVGARRAPSSTNAAPSQPEPCSRRRPRAWRCARRSSDRRCRRASSRPASTAPCTARRRWRRRSPKRSNASEQPALPIDADMRKLDAVGMPLPSRVVTRSTNAPGSGAVGPKWTPDDRQLERRRAEARRSVPPSLLLVDRRWESSRRRRSRASGRTKRKDHRGLASHEPHPNTLALGSRARLQCRPWIVWAGCLVETYRLERLIAEGSMGSVYEARHLRIPKRFAVKFLRIGLEENAGGARALPPRGRGGGRPRPPEHRRDLRLQRHRRRLAVHRARVPRRPAPRRAACATAASCALDEALPILVAVGCGAVDGARAQRHPPRSQAREHRPVRRRRRQSRRLRRGQAARRARADRGQHHRRHGAVHGARAAHGRRARCARRSVRARRHRLRDARRRDGVRRLGRGRRRGAPRADARAAVRRRACRRR